MYIAISIGCICQRVLNSTSTMGDNHRLPIQNFFSALRTTDSRQATVAIRPPLRIMVPKERVLARPHGHNASLSTPDALSSPSPPPVMDNDNNNPVDRLHLTNLPDSLLVNVANYLAKPSVAMFAVAMAGTSSKIWQPTETSNAIISAASYWWSRVGTTNTATNQWQEIDFGDIEESLSSKLTDDDVHSILICVDAIHNLKVLKLIGCSSITGSGLEPLSGSTVLEWIDFSRDIRPPPLPTSRISDDVVISILESIIESPQNKLQYIHFPAMSIDKKNLFVNRHRSLRVCITQGGLRCAAILSSRLPQFKEGSEEPTCPYCADRDVELVMSQADSTWAEAAASLKLHRWDLVDSIMDCLNHI